MLLRHTTKEIMERQALTVNPAKTCQPIGALYAALGVHACLPHSHGSQGCCSYHRSTLTRHYKEPIMAGTSSFTEGSSVFGGGANLLTAFENMFGIYKPEVIAVHSTCLSETIGDDLSQIMHKANNEGKIPAGKKVIYASTPSYVGSHVTGFSSMVKAMAGQLAKKTGKPNNKLNVIPGWVEPSDMKEIKRLLHVMGVDFILYPDTSDVLDAPQTGKHEMYPKGGARVKDIESSGDSFGTLALGFYGSAAAARELDRLYKVRPQVLELPMGLSATDRMIMAISEMAGINVPESINDERGQL
ncbi:MAG: nitrogenase molybdenum-iron protein subunit beta, partial [Spirochaetae bacterium HGW-Spirochaetae-6]